MNTALQILSITSPMTLEAIDFYMDSSIGDGFEFLAPQVGLEPTGMKVWKVWTPIYLILFLGTFHEFPIRNI
jgi:hypothetical protein